jgi:membrane protease YdiL (CAAX protease family)
MLAEKPWRPDLVLQYLTAILLSVIAGMMIISVLSADFFPVRVDGTTAALIIGALSFHGMALVWTHVLLRAHGETWSGAFGFKTGRTVRTLALAVLMGVAILPVVWSLANLASHILEGLNIETAVQQPVQMLQSATSPVVQILIGLLAVVVAPIGEEIIFRGVLYPAIKQRGYPHLALWGTSLLFAAVHGNLMIFLPLTVLAVVLTLLYESTNNLLAPIVTHSMFNLVNYSWLVMSPPQN